MRYRKLAPYTSVTNMMVKDGVLMELTEGEFLALLTPERRAFILDSVSNGVSDYDNPEFYGAEARRDHTRSVIAQIRNCHIVALPARAGRAN